MIGDWNFRTHVRHETFFLNLKIKFDCQFDNQFYQLHYWSKLEFTDLRKNLKSNKCKIIKGFRSYFAEFLSELQKSFQRIIIILTE